MAEKKNPVVKLATNKGAIRIELDAEKAPMTTKNFLEYVSEGYYDGLIFHRVIAGFMIQGGGFDPQMKQKSTKAPIKNEAKNGLKNAVGTIAMARTSVVDSATSQFFINVNDNDFLDHRSESADGYGYAVFGRVIDGMESVRAIEQVETQSRGMHQDVPVGSPSSSGHSGGDTRVLRGGVWPILEASEGRAQGLGSFGGLL
jgi:cyclophilin family peptidyl-prolyl cis-trans isomerase